MSRLAAIMETVGHLVTWSQDFRRKGDRPWGIFAYAIRPLSVCLCVVCVSCLSGTLVHCSQTAGRIKMKLGMYVGLGPGHIVLDGNTAPHPKRTERPFSAHTCCDQMGAWIKMPLDMEVYASAQGTLC